MISQKTEPNLRSIGYNLWAENEEEKIEIILFSTDFNRLDGTFHEYII